jgi:microcystin degradation protein MlrC
MRIAIGGFLHESHSFAPRPTGWAEFQTPGGFPAYVRGAGLFDAVRSTSVPSAGALSVAEPRGVDLVPLSWCFANPAGPVTEEAFERIAACLIADLATAVDEAPLDGLYLDLHGAMVAEHFPDAEGELLRRARAVVGPDVPIAISLDPHANVTALMAEKADVIVPFRTYPHVDMKAAGARAMELLLARIARGAPWPYAYRQLDYWTPLTMQCTMVSPMSDVLAERATLAAGNGIVELGFCFGFPYADFPGCGMAITCYAEDQALADAAADKLKSYLDAHEADFAGGALPVEEGVAQAIAASGQGKPVVIADTQDNPGGGGHGDTTGLLAELIRQDAPATLGMINDAESAASCHAAGEGAEISLKLGGKSDGVPVHVQAKVLRLTDGRFVCTGPMAAGNPADLGPSALLGIGPVKVLVVSRKMQALDQAMFRHAGIEPADEQILALKSSVHFRADFQPIAQEVIVVAAPGPVVADPSSLPFGHLREGVRRRPLG